MATIPRRVDFQGHGVFDWVSRDSYTFAAADTLQYEMQVFDCGGLLVVPQSFRVDSSANSAAIVIAIGARRLQVPPFNDFYNDIEQSSYLLITGYVGAVVNVELYGVSLRASKTLGGRKT